MATKKRTTKKAKAGTKATAKNAPAKGGKRAAPANGSKKTAPAKAKAAKGKMSQLDAAVKVLQEAGKPMTTKEMVERMAAKGYWKSPGGKTPHATLYSALLRELQKKGKEARFKKVDRGQFALNK